MKFLNSESPNNDLDQIIKYVLLPLRWLFHQVQRNAEDIVQQSNNRSTDLQKGERERTLPVRYGQKSATVGDTRDPSRNIRIVNTKNN